MRAGRQGHHGKLMAGFLLWSRPFTDHVGGTIDMLTHIGELVLVVLIFAATHGARNEAMLLGTALFIVAMNFLLQVFLCTCLCTYFHRSIDLLEPSVPPFAPLAMPRLHALCLGMLVCALNCQLRSAWCRSCGQC